MNNQKLNGHDDVFIIFASFEDRFTACTSYVSSRYKIDKGIILYNSSLFSNIQSQSKVDNYILSVKNKMSDCCSIEDIHIIETSNIDISMLINSLLEVIEIIKSSTKNENINITIDISTFTHDILITLLHYIRSMVDNAKIRIVYVFPQDYSKDWLSTGCIGVRNIVGFPGNFKMELPIYLILLGGFESDRAARIVQEYEPAKIALGYVKNPHNDHFFDRGYDTHKKIKSKFRNYTIEDFYFESANIQECYNILKKMVLAHMDKFNIVLAPMCTKLSTIAAFLIAYKYDNIQLAYSIPKEYNYKDYSIGIDGHAIISLDEVLYT